MNKTIPFATKTKKKEDMALAERSSFPWSLKVEDASAHSSIHFYPIISLLSYQNHDFGIGTTDWNSVFSKILLFLKFNLYAILRFAYNTLDFLCTHSSWTSFCWLNFTYLQSWVWLSFSTALYAPLFFACVPIFSRATSLKMILFFSPPEASPGIPHLGVRGRLVLRGRPPFVAPRNGVDEQSMQA